MEDSTFKASQMSTFIAAFICEACPPKSVDVEPMDTKGLVYLYTKDSVRDLSIQGFWYPQGALNPIPTDTRGELNVSLNPEISFERAE